MGAQIRPAIVSLVVLSVVTGLAYPALVTAIAQVVFPRQANGSLIVKDGKVLGIRCYTIADHGAFDACANATKWPAGLFSIITGSYDFPAAHCSVDGVYTNKAPGGVAYRCSFRVTEAAYCIERAMDIMAQKLGMDPAEFRMKKIGRAHV